MKWHYYCDIILLYHYYPLKYIIPHHFRFTSVKYSENFSVFTHILDTKTKAGNVIQTHESPDLVEKFFMIKSLTQRERFSYVLTGNGIWIDKKK